MKLFNRAVQTAVEEQVQPDFEAEALERLEAAKAELVRAREELQSFLRENCRMTAEGMVFLSTGIEGREPLDAKFRELVVAQDRVTARFHECLSKWSALKK